jgi:hypothetical protein
MRVQVPQFCEENPKSVLAIVTLCGPVELVFDSMTPVPSCVKSLTRCQEQLPLDGPGDV